MSLLRTHNRHSRDLMTCHFKTCPCKDCENQGCGAYHDQCEKYAEWKQLQAEEKESPDIWYGYLLERDLNFIKGRRRR